MLQKPYSISIKGQNLPADELIKLTWQTSGDLSVAYQIKVYKNSDNNLAYDSTKLTSFAKTHTIPVDSLINGIEYKIQISLWNSANESINSDFEVFFCSSRPVVTIPAIGTINSPSYNFTASYSQNESVPIRSWIVYLYNSDNVKIFQSDIKTTATIGYLFSNLKSNDNYYIEFEAASSKGLVATSGKISFEVSYTQPNININLSAENTDDAGIQLSWKTIQIIGSTTNAPVYIDGEKIDLTNDTFSFSDGFSVDGDFTLKLWFESIVPDVDLLFLKGQNGTINLQYWSSDNRFHLFKDVYGYRSHNVSDVLIGEAYFICIQQINGDMNIFGEALFHSNYVFLSNNQVVIL